MEKEFLVGIQQVEHIWKGYNLQVKANSQEEAIQKIENIVKNGDNPFAEYNSIETDNQEHICSINEFFVKDKEILSIRTVKILCEEDFVFVKTNAPGDFIQNTLKEINNIISEDEEQEWDNFWDLVKEKCLSNDFVFEMFEINNDNTFEC